MIQHVGTASAAAQPTPPKNKKQPLSQPAEAAYPLLVPGQHYDAAPLADATRAAALGHRRLLQLLNALIILTALSIAVSASVAHDAFLVALAVLTAAGAATQTFLLAVFTPSAALARVNLGVFVLYSILTFRAGAALLDEVERGEDSTRVLSRKYCGLSVMFGASVLLVAGFFVFQRAEAAFRAREHAMRADVYPFVQWRRRSAEGGWTAMAASVHSAKQPRDVSVCERAV